MEYKKVQGIAKINDKIRKENMIANYYKKSNNYVNYISEVYGKEQTYLGYLSELLNVRSKAEELGFGIFDDSDNKKFTDYINEILQFSDIEYVMERDSVGIVSNVDVSKAVKGLVTTNINNYGGKETKMGLISNIMYGNTLLYAAQFNSLRRRKYITPELEKVYGNNLNNVYNLSTLFRINTETGRIAEPDSDMYISILPSSVKDYLFDINPEFRLPEGYVDYGYSHETMYGNEDVYSTVKSTDKNDTKGYKANNIYSVYSEGDAINENINSLNEQTVTDGFSVQVIDETSTGLLKKTREMFANRKINTMVSRFHDVSNRDNNLTQSAVYNNFGISHGRNLLTKESWETGSKGMPVNGYSNPYCRTWTSYHQYSKLKNMIRPFSNDGSFTSINGLQGTWTPFRTDDGVRRLNDNSVLNKNGLVNITPTRDGEVDIKNCMFSIENLAWKDVLAESSGSFKKIIDGADVTSQYEQMTSALSKEQIGPNGGRIMWFPPYDITFSESSSAEWNESYFIGRGEPIYTYVNTKRSGNLSFTMLVDHPAIIDYWMLDKKNNATEDDEQQALRFFAGCDTLDIDEDIISKIQNGEYEGGTVDTKEIEEGTDITFYTFFPNNYSGVDEQDIALEKIFGGANSDESLQTSERQFYLGYEMGVNPMSNLEVSYYGLSQAQDWYLDEVLDYSEAEKSFDSLNDIETGYTLTKEDIITCDFTMYNVSVSSAEETWKVMKRNIEIRCEIELEIKNLQKKKEQIEDTGSTAYRFILDNINELSAKYEELKNEYKGLKNQQDSFNSIKANVENNLKPTSELSKTTPIYVYRDKECNDTFFTGKTAAATAYAKYMVSNANTYKKKELYKFLINKSELVCKDENDNYYISDISEGDNLTYIGFENKRHFSRSGLLIGKNNDDNEFYVNNNGDIKVFADKEDAELYLKNNNLFTIVESKDEFINSSALYAMESGETSTDFKYYCCYYKSTTNAETDLINVINKNITDTELINKTYYANHKFGCLEEMGKEENYGIFQFVYKGKLQEKGDMYNDVQEFIASCDIEKLSTAEMDDTFVVYAQSKTEIGESIKPQMIEGIIDRSGLSPQTYYTPVDRSKLSENLNEKNYFDSKSFGLNSTLEYVRKEMGDDRITFSFGEVYAVLTGYEDAKNYVRYCERAILSQKMGFKGAELEKKMKEVDARLTYLEQVLTSPEGKTNAVISQIDTYGSASSDGNSAKNNVLAKNRADTLSKALKKYSLFKNAPILNKEENNNVSDRSTGGDVSSIEAKKSRFTKISIIVNDKDVVKNIKDSEEKQETKISETKVLIKNNRYDDEYRFFEMLRENDNIAYKRLVDKVKYFSPAYHSLSPEGFNARLTFLHQCTRQGPTMTASDIETGSTAANLAFGRAPFCILRLGDFLNTKIVIRSVSISYPDTMWDLNPEGIGVQFMMAKVDLGIDIIGGSDISAPINRLQNAVSFNYYANTSIYDNRSDRAIYNKSSKKVENVYTWHPDVATMKKSVDS